MEDWRNFKQIVVIIVCMSGHKQSVPHEIIRADLRAAPIATKTFFSGHNL